jgi:AcrR family transcriptional regulator
VTDARRSNRGPSAGPENRRAIIAAAREIFAEAGIQAPLSAVARQAGVGQGSLYRHFPDRLSLAVAVFDDNVSQLEGLAHAEDATLSDLFDQVTEQAMVSSALIDLIQLERHDPRSEALAARVLDVVAALVERDRARGRIRPTVEPEDVMLAITMLALTLSKSDAEERAATAARGRAIFRTAFGYRPGILPD